MVAPAPGDIMDEGFPGGGGRSRGSKPLPPPPIMPDGNTGRPDSGRQPPAESESDPDADQARRDALADEFVEELMKPLEAHRGNETTKKGNDIVAQECRAILKEEFPDLTEKIEHVGGATKDGKGKVAVPEKYLPNEANRKRGLDRRRGSSHPDLTWEHKDAGKETRTHANTVTTKADGKTPTTREQDSFDSLVEKVGAELATEIPKLRRGADENEYRAMARKKCREIFGKLRDKLNKDGDEEPDSEADEP